MSFERNAELYLSAAGSNLAVQLSGHEWHCLGCKLRGDPLTEIGEKFLNSAYQKINRQLRDQTT
jgi:hypothetical protein